MFIEEVIDVSIYESNKELLIKYFENGSKKEGKQKLGVEIEHFIVKRQSLESVSYYGKRGIESMLESLSPLYPHRFEQEGHLLGLYNDDYSLSLEPAGQLEISINPQKDIKTVERIYNKLLQQMKPLLRTNNYQLVTLGYQPQSMVSDLKLIPKKRYMYMDQYFATTGTGGIHMMRGTASAQVAIDYIDEADFVLKYRVAYILMPLLALLTDNSPIYKGQQYSGHLLRNNIWERVDDVRVGMIKGIFDKEFGFDKYAEYLMNLPLIFIPTKDGETYTAEKTIKDLRPEELLSPEDIDHVLSMTFLDVRLKNYIEIRFADSMDFEYVKSYMALIKGIFYHEELLQQIIRTYQVSEADIQSAKDSLSEQGFNGMAYGYKAIELLTSLIADAKAILSDDECQMLEPFERIIRNKKTLAEEYNEKTIS